MRSRILRFVAVLLLPLPMWAATVTVTDEDGAPLELAMVTRSIPGAGFADTSDNGYPRPGLVNAASPPEPLWPSSMLPVAELPATRLQPLPCRLASVSPHTWCRA